MIDHLLRVYDMDNVLSPRVSSEQDHVDFDKWTLVLLIGLGPMTGRANWVHHYHDKDN